MTFSEFVRQACGRAPRNLTAFERAGFHLAHNLGEAPADAFAFLGRFGTVEDVRTWRETNHGPRG